MDPRVYELQMISLATINSSDMLWFDDFPDDQNPRNQQVSIQTPASQSSNPSTPPRTIEAEDTLEESTEDASPERR